MGSQLGRGVEVCLLERALGRDIGNERSTKGGTKKANKGWAKWDGRGSKITLDDKEAVRRKRAGKGKLN